MDKVIDWVVSYLGVALFFLPFTAILGAVLHLLATYTGETVDWGSFFSVTVIVLAIVSMFVEIDVKHQ